MVPVDRKLKWIVDITIGYPERDSLSFPGMIAGIYTPRHVHLHYRVYPIKEVPCDSDSLQTWLYNRYTEKEELLENFYNKQISMDETDKENRKLSKLKEHEIRINTLEIVLLYMFYFISTVVFWHCFYKQIFNLIGWSFSFLF